MLTFICVFGFCSGVLAHEAWLAPAKFKIIINEELQADYKIGSNFKGNTQPFISNWNRDFRLSNGKQNSKIEGEDGQRPAVKIIQPTQGLNILTLHTSTSKLTFKKWEKFQTYLKTQGIQQIESQHIERGLPKEGFTEGYRRCAKTLVQVGEAQGKDQAVGMPLEFVLVKGLYGQEGETVEIKLLWNGQPLGNAQVQVWDKRDLSPENENPQSYFKTDANGSFSFTPKLGGEFMMSSVHMVAADNPKYVWESYWANLTFAR